MDVTGQLLTDEATVNAYDSATTAAPAQAMTGAIGRASETMCRAMGSRIINPKRSLIQLQRVLVKDSSHVFCEQCPVLPGTLVVKMNGTALVEGDDYVAELGSGVITRLSNDFVVLWESGNLDIAFEAGYADLASVPADLKHLATLQTLFELRKIDQRYVGIAQLDPEAGTTLTLEADGLLPSVKEGLRPWKRTSTAGSLAAVVSA